METVLIIISSLFGGLNIFQFIFFRAERRKRNAEADLATMDVKTKDVGLQQDQFNFISEKLTEYLKEYYALDEQMRVVTREYSQTINKKCNEIAELKSKLIYFGGLRCYKSDCSQRVSNKLNDTEDEKN